MRPVRLAITAAAGRGCRRGGGARAPRGVRFGFFGAGCRRRRGLRLGGCRGRRRGRNCLGLGVSSATASVSAPASASAWSLASSSAFACASASARAWILAALAAFTRRGGPSVGAAGLGGSAFCCAWRPRPGRQPVRGRPGERLALRQPDAALAGNPLGELAATISSTVLDALLTSMPWSRRSRSITSWLGMPSSSETL